MHNQHRDHRGNKDVKINIDYRFINSDLKGK